MKLISHSLAASEWGWCKDTMLRNRDVDVYLQELHLYIIRHHRSDRLWITSPRFKSVYSKKNAIDHAEDVLAVRMQELQGIPAYHIAWRIVSVSELATPLSKFYSQSLYSLCIQFSYKHAPFASVIHLLENNRCFYYVKIFYWVARCADPHECVALLDAIEANINGICLEYELRMSNYELFKHYEKSLRFTNDFVRQKYVQFAMGRLEKTFQRHEFAL